MDVMALTDQNRISRSGQIRQKYSYGTHIFLVIRVLSSALLPGFIGPESSIWEHFFNRIHQVIPTLFFQWRKHLSVKRISMPNGNIKLCQLFGCNVILFKGFCFVERSDSQKFSHGSDAFFTFSAVQSVRDIGQTYPEILKGNIPVCDDSEFLQSGKGEVPVYNP